MRTDLFGDVDFAPVLEDEAQRTRTLYTEGVVCARSGIAEMSAAPARCWRRIAKERRERSLAPLPLVKAGMLELVNLIRCCPIEASDRAVDPFFRTESASASNGSFASN